MVSPLPNMPYCCWARRQTASPKKRKKDAVELNFKDSNFQMLFGHWQAHAPFRTGGEEKTNMPLLGTHWRSLAGIERGSSLASPHKHMHKLTQLDWWLRTEEEEILSTFGGWTLLMSPVICPVTLPTAIPGHRNCWSRRASEQVPVQEELQHLCTPNTIIAG